jgi:cytochrome c peroxidase
MDKGCIACHNGNALGGNTYQKFGVYGDYWEHTKSATVDKGRYDITQNDADKYIFKSPSLRNIVKTYPYFHDGSVKDLDEAIKIMGKAQLNMDFSDEEVQAIVAFLHTLTGEVAQEHKM